ncbi:chemotaxis protein CheW [Bdellovibrio sp. KM01]|uniref:chemotaxis protein CheW n=1 Tax=Bdellovibrio sp. KM01 TaxID=2748865 RepID=UPI0015EAE34A|nr:chemotaxis protein CheW [Bdellovibrio sp. KM01]QLY25955.1 chemotaxis protein CheW [Bdellovibrio sp. KM01]
MSDFFGDDFTVELKKYFLDATLKEVESFIDLIDESTLQKVTIEIREKAESWVVDAKSNEFTSLEAWLTDFNVKTDSLDSAEQMIKALSLLQKYLTALLVDGKDSTELALQFPLVAQSSREALFLHCKTGSQQFVVPINNVIEITSSLPLFPLPDLREGLAGVIPFRGEAVPVIDLKSYGFHSVNTNKFYYVICEHVGTRFSLQVTETDELLSLKDKDMQNLSDYPTMLTAPFIKQFFVKEEHSVMVLDIEKLVA